MSILDEAACLIDPVAFDGTEWVDLDTGKSSELARQRKELAKAKARHAASLVLKLILDRTVSGLRHELIAAEIEGWEGLGIPINAIPGAREVIESKYPIAHEAEAAESEEDEGPTDSLSDVEADAQAVGEEA